MIDDNCLRLIVIFKSKYMKIISRTLYINSNEYKIIHRDFVHTNVKIKFMIIYSLNVYTTAMIKITPSFSSIKIWADDMPRELR